MRCAIPGGAYGGGARMLARMREARGRPHPHFTRGRPRLTRRRWAANLGHVTGCFKESRLSRSTRVRTTVYRYPGRVPRYPGSIACASHLPRLIMSSLLHAPVRAASSLRAAHHGHAAPARAPRDGRRRRGPQLADDPHASQRHGRDGLQVERRYCARRPGVHVRPRPWKCSCSQI